MLKDTPAISLKTTKGVSSSCGTPQCQTIAVKIAMESSTKLTQSLTPSTMRMNVRQERLQSAGFYQVCEPPTLT